MIFRKRFFAAAVLAACLASGSAAQDAVVTVSVAHLREAPDYTAEMGTEALMGSTVRILGKDGYWTRVRCPDGYVAWVNDMALRHMTDQELSAWRDLPKVIVTGEYGTVSSGPESGAGMVCDIVRGNILADMGQVRKGFRYVMTPSGRKGWVRKDLVENHEHWKSTRLCSGDAVADEALRHLGIAYLWGGMSPKGFDCSGLSAFSFLMNGVLLPRNASQQAKLGSDVDISGLAACDFSQLRRGDLLFFGNRDTGRVTHVGIYTGDGRMVHASQIVRVNSIVPGRSDSYENLDRLLFARRIAE